MHCHSAFFIPQAGTGLLWTCVCCVLVSVIHYVTHSSCIAAMQCVPACADCGCQKALGVHKEHMHKHTVQLLYLSAYHKCKLCGSEVWRTWDATLNHALLVTDCLSGQATHTKELCGCTRLLEPAVLMAIQTLLGAVLERCKIFAAHTCLC